MRRADGRGDVACALRRRVRWKPYPSIWSTRRSPIRMSTACPSIMTCWRISMPARRRRATGMDSRPESESCEARRQDAPPAVAPQGQPLELCTSEPARFGRRTPRSASAWSSGWQSAMSHERVRDRFDELDIDWDGIGPRPSARVASPASNARRRMRGNATWSPGVSTVHKPWRRAAVTQATLPLPLRRSSELAGAASGAASERRIRRTASPAATAAPIAYSCETGVRGFVDCACRWSGPPIRRLHAPGSSRNTRQPAPPRTRAGRGGPLVAVRLSRSRSRIASAGRSDGRRSTSAEEEYPAADLPLRLPSHRVRTGGGCCGRAGGRAPGRRARRAGRVTRPRARRAPGST